MNEEIVGYIRVTNDYSKFKRLNGNRQVSEGRKNKLKTSIETIGYMMGSPILVNERFEIIDGQARFAVCKEKHLPIYFVIQEGISQKECISMNRGSTNWKREDYIYHYAELGNPNYIFLKELHEEYEYLSFPVLMNICNDSLFNTTNLTTKIDQGLFVVDEQQKKEIIDIVTFANSIGKTIKTKGRKDLLITSFVWVYRHSDADEIRLKKIVSDVNLEIKINNIGIGTIIQGIQLIENSYNKGLKKNRRFFVLEYKKYNIEKDKGKERFYEED